MDRIDELDEQCVDYDKVDEIDLFERMKRNLKEADNQFVKTENDEYIIRNWDGYPDGPRPQGTVSIIEGDEYEDARKIANRINSEMHRNDSSLRGLQIHEIKPVKFGGSPSEVDNKIPLTPKEHMKYTKWWNRRLREFKEMENNND